MIPPNFRFDALIRRQLDVSSGRSDWDLPSGSVWESIHAEIHPRRRRRVALWWLLGGLFLLFSGIAGYLFFAPRPSPADDSIHTPHVTYEENPPVISDRNEDVNNGVSANQDTGSEAKPEHATEQYQRASDRALLHSHLNSTTLHSLPAGPSQPTPSALQILHTEIQDHLASELSAADQNFTDSRNPDEHLAHMTHDPALVCLTQEMTPLELPERNLNSTPSPLLATSKLSRWSLTMHGAPAFGTRHISVPDGSPLVQRMRLREEETPTLQPSAGITLMYHHHSRWEFGLGAVYQGIRLEGESSYQLRYTRGGERINGRGNIENRLPLLIRTSFGAVHTDMIVERSSGAPIEEHRFIDIGIGTTHRIGLLEIPLVAGYRLSNGKLNTTLYGGITGNIVLDNTLSIHTVKTSGSGVMLASTHHTFAMSDTRSMIWGYHFGVGFALPVHPQWSVVLQPRFSGSFQSIYKTTDVAVRPVVYAMQAGIRYSWSSSSGATFH